MSSMVAFSWTCINSKSFKVITHFELQAANECRKVSHNFYICAVVLYYGIGLEILLLEFNWSLK